MRQKGTVLLAPISQACKAGGLVTTPTVRLVLETITATLKEQLERNADTATLVKTIASLSTVMARHGANETVRAAAQTLQLRSLRLSQASQVPRFIVHDMLEDFVQRIQSQSHRRGARASADAGEV